MLNRQVKRVVVGILILAMVGEATAGKMLWINPQLKKAWIIDDSTGVPVATPFDVQTIHISGGTGGPTPNPNPDPNPIPPQDEVTKKIAAFTPAYIRTADEAAALVALISELTNLVRTGKADADQFEGIMEASIPVISKKLKMGDRLAEWYAELLKLGPVSVDLLDKSAVALAYVYKIDGASLRMAIAAAKRGDTMVESAFDILLILELIRMVFELLTKLGIL